MLAKLYILSVILHILAAMIWIGGMMFLVLVLVPVIRRPSADRALPRELAVQLVRDTGRRFRGLGWICLLTLIITGITNLLCRGIGWTLLKDPSFWSGPFGQTLAWKLSLVGTILVLSVVHDFSIGPRASELLQQRPEDPRALRYRLAATWMGRLNLLLSLAVLALAVMLVRGRPW